jgi:sporulation protein YlmC with PRC-barrel domain
MAKKKVVLHQDTKNANRHTKTGAGLVKKSLTSLGAGRSILLDKNNNIIAGNLTAEEWEKIGGEVKIIETDGKELIAVKRTDLDINSRKARELAIADNRTSQASLAWDFGALKDLEREFKLNLGEWGINPSFGVFDPSSPPEEGTYSRKIISPIYEPKAEKPELSELFDTSKTDALIEKINASKIPEEEKVFLRAAAARHTVLRFDRIAEYYAHSKKKAQELMEDSALVIIDFNRAIELGYAKLSEEVAAQYGEDYA